MLTTLLSITSGAARVAGADVAREPDEDARASASRCRRRPRPAPDRARAARPAGPAVRPLAARGGRARRGPARPRRARGRGRPHDQGLLRWPAPARPSPRHWSTSPRCCSSTSRRPARSGEPAHDLGRAAAHQPAAARRSSPHTQYLEEADQVRPPGHHRRRPDRARGAPARLKAELRERGGLEADPTLDDVFLDATGRTRGCVAGDVQGGVDMTQAWVLGQRALREGWRTPDKRCCPRCSSCCSSWSSTSARRRRSPDPRRRSCTGRATARSSCPARCCFAGLPSGPPRCSSSRTSRAATSTSCARR